MKNESISTACSFKQHTRLHGQALYMGLYELLEFCLLHTVKKDSFKLRKEYHVTLTRQIPW